MYSHFPLYRCSVQGSHQADCALRDRQEQQVDSQLPCRSSPPAAGPASSGSSRPPSPAAPAPAAPARRPATAAWTAASSYSSSSVFPGTALRLHPGSGQGGHTPSQGAQGRGHAAGGGQVHAGIRGSDYLGSISTLFYYFYPCPTLNPVYISRADGSRVHDSGLAQDP